MNKTHNLGVRLLLLWSMVAVHAQAQPITPKSLSLQQAIDYALENNVEIKNAGLETQVSEQKVKEILAAGLPQVSATADLVHNHNIQTAYVPANAFDPTGDPNAVGALAFGVSYMGIAQVRAEQMLFNGAYFIGLKAAKVFTELSRKAHTRTKIEVVELVSKAYYTVLLNRRLAELVHKNYSRLDSLLRDTKIMQQNGFVEKIDVDRIQVQFNNIKVERDHVDKMVHLSETLFKYHIGMPLDTPIELTDKIEDANLDRKAAPVENFDYGNRIEFSSLLIQQELNQIDLKNIRSGYIPEMNLYATYGANTGTLAAGDLFNTGDYPWHRLGVIGINLHWTLFDGFRKRAAAQQRQFKASQISNGIDNMRESINLELERTTSSYNRNIDNMLAQKENMKLARAIYNTTQQKYKEGVGSNSEVLDADASLKEAQTNYYHALFAALTAKIDMQKALGKLHE